MVRSQTVYPTKEEQYEEVEEIHKPTKEKLKIAPQICALLEKSRSSSHFSTKSREISPINRSYPQPGGISTPKAIKLRPLNEKMAAKRKLRYS